MSNNNKSSILAAGMVIGGVLGTVTGILMAPRSGKETRRILKKSADALPEMAEDLSTTVQLQADRLSESALQNWNDTLTRLKDTIAAGLEASKGNFENSQTSSSQMTMDSASSSAKPSSGKQT
ncbi:MAG: YtxH domain-containing protein [cyanobacterium endosymbiont of Rhopalodia musculus]|uniref:YtxH domain-containing protein n=1 Tax=cyanobacterium endosymbiont of Epithemia clementina EcSB TaxID=3034674 RepID=UPI002480004E|nr:YtxH domain-containing protein [cyanobacterium endosymbiont of Epithemia clementina EcSB]WGT67922.1 YtxH domain-containing protein [cyanobacterium endosymbiont of Epithemia clementina EcSB]